MADFEGVFLCGQLRLASGALYRAFEVAFVSARFVPALQNAEESKDYRTAETRNGQAAKGLRRQYAGIPTKTDAVEQARRIQLFFGVPSRDCNNADFLLAVLFFEQYKSVYDYAAIPRMVRRVQRRI